MLQCRSFSLLSMSILWPETRWVEAGQPISALSSLRSNGPVGLTLKTRSPLSLTMSQQQDNHQPTEYSDAHTSEHSDATEYSDKGMRNTPTKGSKRAPLSDDPRLDKIANVMLMMLYYGVSRSVDIP